MSASELADSIRAMTDADKLRFKKASSYLSYGGSLSPEDLRQEAMRRALDGTRKCPRHVKTVVFLIGAMRSIAFAGRKSANRAPTLSVVPREGGKSQSCTDFADNRKSPEDQIVQDDTLKEIKERVLALFEGDIKAQTIVEGIMDGMEGEELRELVELENTEFASKRRLIRRRLDAAFPNGWKS